MTGRIYSKSCWSCTQINVTNVGNFLINSKAVMNRTGWEEFYGVQRIKGNPKKIPGESRDISFDCNLQRILMMEANCKRTQRGSQKNWKWNSEKKWEILVLLKWDRCRCSRYKQATWLGKGHRPKVQPVRSVPNCLSYRNRNEGTLHGL